MYPQDNPAGPVAQDYRNMSVMVRKCFQFQIYIPVFRTVQYGMQFRFTANTSSVLAYIQGLSPQPGISSGNGPGPRYKLTGLFFLTHH